MDVVIRKATPDDAEQLIAHVQRLAEEPGRNVPLAPGEFKVTADEERKILADYAAAENSVFLVALVDSRVVGTLNCSGGKRQATRHAAALGMSVRQEWRNQGIGTLLLDAALQWAASTGVVKRIELQVYERNKVAMHLYENFGFEVEGKRRCAVYQDGAYLDDLIMARLL